MTQPATDVLTTFTDDQLVWLASQPGPIKRLAVTEQQRRAAQPQGEQTAGTSEQA